jgi:hypothetical protein
MNKPHVSSRHLNNRLARRFALTALCLGTAYGCAVSNAEGEGEGAADGVESGLAPADIGTIGPMPTVTTVPTTLPPFEIVSHATIDLHPGHNDTETVTDDDKRSPYRVKVKDTLGLNGTISVGLSTSVAPSTTTCPQFSFEYTVEGYRESTESWVPLTSKTKTGSYSVSGGEFPTPSCNLSLSYDIDNSVYTNLRVAAKGSRRTVLNGTTIVQAQNTSVSVSGTNPVPDPGRELHITGVTLSSSKRDAGAYVKNDGPLTATSVSATLTGSYKYCRPALPGESNYCRNNGEQTAGYFANPDINPGGNPVWPHRSAKTCTIAPQVDSNPGTIIDDQTVAYSWLSSIRSNDAGCPPCDPTDGRCYGIVLKVTTDSAAETDPWDDWDQDSSTKAFPGLVVAELGRGAARTDGPRCHPTRKPLLGWQSDHRARPRRLPRRALRRHLGARGRRGARALPVAAPLRA